MYANNSKADKPVFTPNEEPSFPWLLELISVRNLYEWRNKSLLIVGWELFETMHSSGRRLILWSLSFKKSPGEHCNHAIPVLRCNRVRTPTLSLLSGNYFGALPDIHLKGSPLCGTAAWKEPNRSQLSQNKAGSMLTVPWPEAVPTIITQPFCLYNVMH